MITRHLRTLVCALFLILVSAVCVLAPTEAWAQGVNLPVYPLAAGGTALPNPAVPLPGDYSIGLPSAFNGATVTITVTTSGQVTQTLAYTAPATTAPQVNVPAGTSVAATISGGTPTGNTTLNALAGAGAARTLATGAGGCGVVGGATGCQLPVYQAPNYDGNDNVDRPVKALYSDGPAIEYPSQTLTATGAFGPLAMAGYESITLNVAINAGTATITFNSNPSNDNTTFTTAIPCIPLGGGTAVSSITATGTYVCTRDGVNAVGASAIEAKISACSSCNVTLTPTKSGAQPGSGVSLFAPPAVFNSIFYTHKYDGLVVNPANLVLEYSTTPSDNAVVPTVGTGECDVGTDISTSGSPSSGAHTRYAVAGLAQGYGQTYGPASNIDPFGCVGGALTATMQWDATNSRYVQYYLELASQDFFQIDGFVPRQDRYYVDQTQTWPSGITTAFVPWWDPIWGRESTNYANLGTSNWLNGATQGDHEGDFPGEWGLTANVGGSTGVTDFGHYIAHYHDQPGLTRTAGTSQVLRTINGDAQVFNPSTGTPVHYGQYVTHNYICGTINFVITGCVLKPDLKASAGRPVIKNSGFLFVNPTAPTSYTLTTVIGPTRIYYLKDGAPPPLPIP